MINYKKLSKAALIALLDESQAEILHLKNVLDHLPGSIYWKNKDGVYLGHNEFAAHTVRLLGYDWENIIGKTDADLFPEQVAAEFCENDQKVMETETELITEEITVTIEGHRVVQLSTKKPFYDKMGQVAGIIGNSVNITRLKEIEVELQQAKDSAELANRLNAQIIQNMEHDIRTPFAGILALSNLLTAKETDADKKDKLSSITSCAQELLNYCNEMIDIVNVDANQVSRAPVLFNCRDLVKSLISVERPAAIIRNLSVVFECDEDVPAYLLGDRARLYRVLLNLLSNAIKFTLKGQVNISIRLAQKNVGNKVDLIFVVSDTGIGIPAEKQSEIFKKFFKVTPSNHGHYKGTGLGLSFVKQFVEDMQGSINVESEVGRGTRFTCQLPFTVASEHVPAAEQETIREKTEMNHSVSPHLLLVEDHIISQKVTKQVLNDLNCIVDAVDNGRDAILAARKKQYDCILVDIGLPDIDGFTVISTIQNAGALNQNTPIAVLTAHSLHDYRDKALEHGIQHFVVKPITSDIAATLLKETVCQHKVASAHAIKRKHTLDGVSFYYQQDTDIGQFHEIFHAGLYDCIHLRDSPVVMDLSANIGLFPLYTKLLHPSAEVICYEPDPEKFKLLNENCQLFQLQSVATYQGCYLKEAVATEHLSTTVDLLKLDLFEADIPLFEAMLQQFQHIDKLIVTLKVNSSERKDVAIDKIRKAMVPFYRSFKVVENPKRLIHQSEGRLSTISQSQQHVIVFASRD